MLWFTTFDHGLFDRGMNMIVILLTYLPVIFTVTFYTVRCMMFHLMRNG